MDVIGRVCVFIYAMLAKSASPMQPNYLTICKPSWSFSEP